MTVEKKNIREIGGSCMCCDRGELSKAGYNIIYPYDFVYVIVNTNNLEVRICEECIEHINTAISYINKMEVTKL